MTGISQRDALLGQVLNNTYRVDSRIGSGGMGAVYRGMQISLQRPVAIKVLQPTVSGSNEIRQRFFREARLLSQLNHPNIVMVFDFGATPDGMLFMAMELLTGRTLADHVSKVGGLTLDEILAVMEELAAGVGAAHALSMIHRDLKPQNVMLVRRNDGSEVLKVLDFGIGKALGDTDSANTRSGRAMGTPGYIAPEQIQCAVFADHRSDVYALGGILYFLITGRPPYTGRSVTEVLNRQVAEWPDPIDLVEAELPQDLWKIILAAMSIDREQRYQSAQELLADLRRLAASPMRGKRRAVGTDSQDVITLKGVAYSTMSGEPAPEATMPADDPGTNTPAEPISANTPSEEATGSTPAHGVPHAPIVTAPHPPMPPAPPPSRFGLDGTTPPPSRFGLDLGERPATPHRLEAPKSRAGISLTPPTPHVSQASTPVDMALTPSWEGPPPVPPAPPAPPPSAPASGGRALPVLAVLAVLGAGAFWALHAPHVPTQPLSTPAGAVRGVTDAEVLLGMTAPFTGPSSELGVALHTGVSTALREINDAGGIAGRHLLLATEDDGYEPDVAKQNVTRLLDEKHAFALIGCVGTQPAVQTIPVAVDRKALFFAPFTGASLLRKQPPQRYVFNFRASYAEETATMLRYLTGALKIAPDAIAVFAQADAFGDDGYAGVVRELKQMNIYAPPLRVGYRRNAMDVDEAVKQIVAHKDRVRAIIDVATAKPAALFIKKVRDAGVDCTFGNVSFAVVSSLNDELMTYGPQYAKGVLVSEVVPHWDAPLRISKAFVAALKRYFPAERPSYVALEGYASATLIAEAITRAGKDLDAEKLADALERMQSVDIGLGVALSFGPSNHQACNRVWLSRITGTGKIEDVPITE